MIFAGGQSLRYWSGAAYRSPAFSRALQVGSPPPRSSCLRGPFFADYRPGA